MPEFCVAVVGTPSCELSQTTDGSGRRKHVGIGKSCLCSRFVRPSSDDYRAVGENFPSVVSWSEFNGPEINSVHSLNFGRTVKQAVDSERPVAFRVVEHTTLVDENYRPHRKSTSGPYIERATATEFNWPSREEHVRVRTGSVSQKQDLLQARMDVQSAEIGGFVLLVDPTRQAQELQAQLELIEALVQRIDELRKPYALALTKCDLMAADDLEHIEQTVAFHLSEVTGGGVPIFQVSASTGVAVDLPFHSVFAASQGCRHIIDMHQPYSLASCARQQAARQAANALKNVLDDRVVRFNMTWSELVRSLCTGATCDVAALAAVYSLCGIDTCRELFRIRLVHLFVDEQVLEFRRACVSVLAGHPDRPDQVVDLDFERQRR